MIASSMGVGAFTPTDLRKVLAGKTASVSGFISETADGFSGNSSNKDMETMFQLLYLQATAPRKDSALFKSTIQRNKAQYLMMGANPQYSFVDTTFHVLFQRNPLASGIPKAEHFDKIDMERSMAIYRERLGDLAGMHFTIVGSFPEETLMPLIETYLASLPASGPKTTYTDAGVRPFKGQQEFVYRKGKEEKSLILGVLGGEIPYSYTMARKMNALSEILNILIIEEMREKIQGIYGGGTTAEMTKAPYSSFQLILQLPCGPEKADTLQKEFHRELARLAEKGPDQKYLDKVKKQWLESYRTEIKTNEFWLSKLIQLRKGESTTAQFLAWEKEVNALTPADVQEAAKLVYNAPTRLVAILMPEKK
jgi:zinc protease